MKKNLLLSMLVSITIYGNKEKDSGAEGMNYIGTKMNNYSKMVTQFQFMSRFLDRDLIFFEI